MTQQSSNIRIVVPNKDGTTTTLDHDPIAYRKHHTKGGLGPHGREQAVSRIMEILNTA